jgi:hypothetical protein
VDYFIMFVSYLVGYGAMYAFLSVFYYGDTINRYKAFTGFEDEKESFAEFTKADESYIERKVNTAKIAYSVFWPITMIPMFAMYVSNKIASRT